MHHYNSSHSYWITAAAARFLRSHSPSVVDSEPDGRFELRASPETISALKQGLQLSRSRGVRSSLRAALSRFSPADVLPRREPGPRTYLLWKRARTRKYLVKGYLRGEAEDTCRLEYYLRSAARREGRLRVLEATSAGDARRQLQEYEAGERSYRVTSGQGTETGKDHDHSATGRKTSRAIGLGLSGAMAVWRVVGWGVDPREALTRLDSPRLPAQNGL